MKQNFTYADGHWATFSLAIADIASAPHMCAFRGKADFRKLTKSLLAALCVDPLHQLEGNPLGTFEESKPPTDVIHLIAQHVHPVGHQVAGHRGDIIDA